jgi:predicted enzyme related to lactoylglutathione lyase
VIKGLTYAILTSSDLPKARRFFTEQLGLTTEDDQGDVFSQFTTREGTMWAIMHAPNDTAGYEVYFRVENADDAYRTWQKRGVEMVTAPHDEPFGRTFSFRDPDGHVLNAYHRPQ